MFTGTEKLRPILEEVRKGGYMPFLLLVRDPNGPLASNPHHPNIHSEIEIAHMDELKEMVKR